jgi:enoyl-[acyl-carrier protein] reductase II
MFGIRYPIFLGGMSWITRAELVCAVGNAGGLGFIGSGGMKPSDLAREIRKIRDLIGENPFGVNLLLMDPNIRDHIAVVCEERVPVVSTGGGNPEPFLSALKKAEIKVLPVIASCALATRMEKLGVDAIIAEGLESGGHVGSMTTMTLIPQVVDQVSIPVVAAGGIGDTRGLLAAFLLGAEAVQMGTLFLTASECSAHPRYKAGVLAASDRSTVVTGGSIGRPVRALKNSLTRQMEKMESRSASLDELSACRRGRLRAAAIDGDVSAGFVMCGQVAGLLKEERSVQGIFHDLLDSIPWVLHEKLLHRMPVLQQDQEGKEHAA